jgi:hypothetical protein
MFIDACIVVYDAEVVLSHAAAALPGTLLLVNVMTRCFACAGFSSLRCLYEKTT